MPIQDESFIRWLGAGMTALFLAVITWMNGRIEHRVRKDVFEVSMKSVDDTLKTQTKILDRQTQTLDKIFDKLDGKQDKE